MSKRLMPFAVMLLAAWPAMAPAQLRTVQAPASIAMVSDYQGLVRTVRGKDARAVEMADELAADTRIELPAGATIVLVLLASGEQATVKGPATALIRADGISSTPAGALTKNKAATDGGPLRRKDLAQASIVLRKTDQTARLPLASLAGTLTLEERPDFRWAPVAASGPYRFVLFDAEGKVLHEATTEATQLSLPAAITLVPGRVYTWEVSTRRANGLEYSNFGDFALAPPALRATAQRLRPPPGAAFADRFTYALWLDSAELSDAARDVWRTLAAERPNEARLRRLAEP